MSARGPRFHLQKLEHFRCGSQTAKSVLNLCLLFSLAIFGTWGCDALQEEDPVALPNKFVFAGAENLTENEDGTYTLSWQAAPFADAVYKIYEGAGAGAMNFDEPVAQTRDTLFISGDLRLSPRTCYVVRLFRKERAVDQNKTALCTRPFESTFAGARSLVRNDGGTYTISWDPLSVSGAVIYSVYEMQSTAGVAAEPLQELEDLQTEVGPFPLGERRCFVVRARLPGLDAFDENSRAVCTEDNVLTGFLGIEGAVSARPGVVTLNWSRDENPDVAGYVVYEGSEFKRPVQRIDDPLATSFELTNQPAFARLTFGVRAVTRFGSEDSNRRTATVRVSSDAALPFAGLAGLDLENGKDAVLRWNPVEHAASYRIYRATSAAGDAPSFDFQNPEREVEGRSSGTVTIFGLGDELRHSFVVRSVSLFGVEDQNSRVLSVDTPDAGPPVFAGIREARMEDGAARLNWDRPVGQVSSFRIYRNKGSGSFLDLSQTDVPPVDGSATSAVVTGFSNGQDYTFLVRAVDAHGAEDQNINFVTLTAAAQKLPFFYGYVSAQGVDEGSIRVRFNNAAAGSTRADAGIASYQVSVRKPGQSQWLQTVYVSQDLSKLQLEVDVDGLSRQTEYEFLVRSVDRWGNASDNELTIRGRTKDLSPPDFDGVGAVQQTTGGSEISISWTPSPSTDIDHYRVYYSQSSMDSYEIDIKKPLPHTVLVTDSIPALETQYVFPALEKAKTYYFMVRAFDVWGNEDANTLQTSWVVQNTYPSLGADATSGATPELVPMAVIQLLASDPDTGDPLEYQQVSTSCDTSVAPFQLVVGARQGKKRPATLSWMPPQDYIEAGRSDRNCTVSFRVSDGQSQSPVLTLSLQAYNRPPYNVTATIAEPPEGFKRGSAFNCAGDADDEDGNLPVYTYQWVKNGDNVTGATSASLAAGAIPLVPGDELQCEVTAADGHDPVTALSDPVVFGNSPPQNLSVQISEVGGVPPYKVGDTIRCLWAGSDADADPITFGAVRVESSVNGVAWADAALPAAACASVLPDRSCFLVTPSAARKQLRCAVQGASDPYAQVTTPFYSSVATVTNADPVISQVVVNFTGAKAELGTVLTCQPTISDADGDALAIQPVFTWYRDGGVISGASNPQYTLTNADRGKPVRCSVDLVTGADGHGSSAVGPALSSTILYANSDPTVTSVTVSPSTAATGTTLTCNHSVTDRDGDALNADPTFLTYSWYANDGTVNGLISGASLKTYTVLASDRGKAITCRVRLQENIDGFGSAVVGPVASSNTVTPVNTPPLVTGVTVTSNETPARTGSTLSCSYTFSDLDGDALVANPIYSWTIGGVVISGQSAVNYTVRASDRGSELRCRVQFPANADGKGSAATTPVAAAAAVTPQNTPPEVAGVSITTAVFPPYYVGAAFQCTPQILRDFDFDPIVPVYSWLRDNAVISGASSSTYTATAADRDTSLTCRISLPVGDGFDTTPISATSDNSMNIGNRAPTNSFSPSLVRTSGRPDLFRDEVVKCQVSLGAWPDPADPDQDTVTVSYVWTLNGSFFPGTDETGTSSDTLDLNMVPGPLDDIACRVRLSDGLAVSLTALSSALTVKNQPPVFSTGVWMTDPVIRASSVTNSINCSVPTASDPDGGAVTLTYGFEVMRRNTTVWTSLYQYPGGIAYTALPSRSSVAPYQASTFWNAGEELRCVARAEDEDGGVTLRTSDSVWVQNAAPQGSFSCNGGESEIVANPGQAFQATGACDKSAITDADGDDTRFAFDTDLAHTTCTGLGTKIMLDPGTGVLTGVAPASPCTVSVRVIDTINQPAESSGVIQRHTFSFFIPFAMSLGKSYLDESCVVHTETSFQAGAVSAASSSFTLSSLAQAPQNHTNPLTANGEITAQLNPASAGNLLISWQVVGQNPIYTTTVSRSLVLEESPATGSSSVVAPMPGVQADSARDGTGLSATGCSLAPCTGERASVAAGLDHSCAVVEGGGVFCFGRNALGQLGLGFTGRPVPDVYHALEVDLDGHTARRVTAGGDLLLDSPFTCALVDGGAGPAAGGVMCWGEGSRGQLGNGAAAPTTPGVPELVTGLTGTGADPEVVAISAGRAHACALLKETSSGMGGAVRCWGYNSQGQLGDNSRTNRLIPVAVQGFETSGALALAAGGSHTCAVTTSQGVKCWGDNQFNQLGIPISDVLNPRELLPVSVSGLTNVTGLAAGLDHTCALISNGDVKCWGSVSYGQVGTGTVGLSVETPAPASGGVVSGAVAISAGGNHTCAVLQSGAVKCWGANESGQLGSGSQVAIQATPVSMANVSNNGLAVSLGLRHSCLALSTGAVKCFGSNASGQLGLELAQISPTNAAVPFPSATPAVPQAQFQDCRVFRAYEPSP